MEHHQVSDLLAMLEVMLGVAKLGATLSQRLGQPAALGELLVGIPVGHSGLRLVDSGYETIQMLSELGVFILLLAIGWRPRRNPDGGGGDWQALCRVRAYLA